MNVKLSHTPDGSWLKTSEIWEVIQSLESENATLLRQRDELAEALREMRYGHTDKAERMAAHALRIYEPNALGQPPATGGEATNHHQP